MASAPTRAYGNRAVFNHFQIMTLGDGEDTVHIARHAQELYEADRFRPRRDRGFDTGNVDIAGRKVTIDKNRSRAYPLHGVHSRHVSLCRHDHFITRSDTHLQIGKVESRHAGADADTVTIFAQELS